MGETEKRYKGKILIVDDDPETCSFLATLLSDLYAVTVVHDGKSALEKIEAENNSTNVVVLDYRLPDMSGLEVLREIKKTKPHIPVIFISAYGDDVAVKAFRHGAKDYLKKPFNYNEFLNTVQFSVSLASLDKRKPRKVLTAEIDHIASEFVEATNNSVTKYNLQKALIYINNNYMAKISLEKVAKTACTSKYHFSREFKKIIGCTYQAYLKKLRMEKARELLKNSDLSITEAAFSVGYADLTNFERNFKKIMGCTPKEYKISHDKPLSNN